MWGFSGSVSLQKHAARIIEDTKLPTCVFVQGGNAEQDIEDGTTRHVFDMATQYVCYRCRQCIKFSFEKITW